MGRRNWAVCAAYGLSSSPILNFLGPGSGKQSIVMVVVLRLFKVGPDMCNEI